MTEQPNPNELLLITREELERCCSQMSAAGYKVSANYVEASVLSRSLPAPAALETEHEQYERICKEVSQEQHDATIRQQGYEQGAKDERNKVLEKVIAFCKSNDCVQKTYGDIDCQSTTDAECVICFCESLRREVQE